MKTEQVKVGTCYLVRVGRLLQPCRVVAMVKRTKGTVCALQNLVTNRYVYRSPRALQAELSETLAKRLTIIRKSI